MSAKPDANEVDPATRALVAAVRTVVSQLTADLLRMQAYGSEDEAARYAQAALEAMPVLRLPALVAAHDNQAAALNAASPDFLQSDR